MVEGVEQVRRLLHGQVRMGVVSHNPFADHVASPEPPLASMYCPVTHAASSEAQPRRHPGNVLDLAQAIESRVGRDRS